MRVHDAGRPGHVFGVAGSVLTIRLDLSRRTLRGARLRPLVDQEGPSAYLKANPKVRRRFNDAVLKAVYVEDGKIKRAEFTDVFAALFSRPSSNKWVKVPPARHSLHLCRDHLRLRADDWS